MTASTKWDLRFLERARLTASWSKDPSTKVGCVVVNDHRAEMASGYNGFPRGVADDDRLDDRERKYALVVHAEANAVAHAAREGVSLDGCTLYSTLCPCTQCASLLIQAGIQTVVAPAKWPERWDANMQQSIALMREAGLTLRLIG
jgi:dCMP deaminase